MIPRVGWQGSASRATRTPVSSGHYHTTDPSCRRRPKRDDRLLSGDRQLVVRRALRTRGDRRPVPGDRHRAGRPWRPAGVRRPQPLAARSDAPRRRGRGLRDRRVPPLPRRAVPGSGPPANGRRPRPWRLPALARLVVRLVPATLGTHHGAALLHDRRRRRRRLSKGPGRAREDRRDPRSAARGAQLVPGRSLQRRRRLSVHARRLAALPAGTRVGGDAVQAHYARVGSRPAIARTRDLDGLDEFLQRRHPDL